MGRKKPGRKAVSASKRGIAWPRWTGFRGMTVRDLLQLLMIPLAIVVVGLWFTAHQDARQQQIEDRRAASDRQIAEQSAQDYALQAYLDQMSTLLLDEDLRTSDEDSEARTLARARTLLVLGRLDPSRKTEVMEFLVEEELVGGNAEGKVPIIRLDDADLSGADLSSPYINHESGGVSLLGAYLNDADLSGANLHSALLAYAGMLGANLSGADLSGAYLTDANLPYADLSRADLSGADLTGANLSFADLSDAKGVTNEELEQKALSLVDATMPNGQKCEDWLERKECGEDGEDSGPS